MKETVSTSKRGMKFRVIKFFANVFFISSIVGTLGFSYYDEYRKEKIYDALNISFTEVREIEYGTENYNTLDLVSSIDNGEIIDYTKEIDTSIVGVKELKYEINNEDVSKEYKIQVEVKDTKNPIVEFKYKTITLYVGNTYVYKNNVKSVRDEVDGELTYVNKVPETNEHGYYTISTDLNNKKIGTYTVTVTAVDKNENTTVAKYNIKVIARPVAKTTTKTTTTNTTATKTVVGNYNGPSSVDTSSVVNAAKSLLGSKYVYGASSPSTGFDCSGFVSYIYRLFGKSLSRTAKGMASNGKAVSEANMQPGDIIVWSHRSDMVPTHVSLYIGNGQMIHAANKRKGVILSDVSYWKNGGKNKIVTIRRV